MAILSQTQKNVQVKPVAAWGFLIKSNFQARKPEKNRALTKIISIFALTLSSVQEEKK